MVLNWEKNLFSHWWISQILFSREFRLIYKINYKEVFRFLLVGCIAAFANISSRIIFSRFFSYKLSIIFSFLIGLSTGFIFMRNYVFVFKKNLIYLQIQRFILINLLNLIQTFFISLGLNYLLSLIINKEKLVELIAHVVGVLFPGITSYFAHKYFTFK